MIISEFGDTFLDQMFSIIVVGIDNFVILDVHIFNIAYEKMTESIIKC